MMTANWPIAPIMPPRSDFFWLAMRCLRREPARGNSKAAELRPARHIGMDAALKRKSPIRQVNLPGRIARLVGGQINGERRYLLRGAEAPHGLAIDEVRPHGFLSAAGILGKRRDA